MEYISQESQLEFWSLRLETSVADEHVEIVVPKLDYMYIYQQ